MLDFNKLLFFTHKINNKDCTIYHFKRILNEQEEIRGEIKIYWNKKNGVSYNLYYGEKLDQFTCVRFLGYVSISDEKWFENNLHYLSDVHTRSYSISSIFRGEE